MAQMTSCIWVQANWASDSLNQEWAGFGFRQRSPSCRIEVRIHSQKFTLEKKRKLIEMLALQFLAKFFKRRDIRGEEMRTDRIALPAGLHRLKVYSILQETAIGSIQSQYEEATTIRFFADDSEIVAAKSSEQNFGGET